MLDRTLRIRRLDPATGATLAMTVDPIASGSVAPHMAVDRSDKLFVSNGGFANDKPPLVVCALIENGGHGGTSAAPAALRVFEQWFGTTGGPIQQIARTD